MAVVPVFQILLVAVITRCRCEPPSQYHDGAASTQYGDILKPPPLPPLSNILPVPFHGGRSQRQNLDLGYQYPPPPPPPPTALSSQPTNDFKLPSPFYKQYNFNFVPPPQPFSTTQSPSIYNKVQEWLLSSQQQQQQQQSGFNSQTQLYSVSNNNNIQSVKKDCNSCNLVPWIPVIRYLGAKTSNQNQNNYPTYGPPSPTAYANTMTVPQFEPQPFKSQAQLVPSAPHQQYGPPQQFNHGVVSSTYGPPSPTHPVGLPSQNPSASTYSSPLSSFSAPSSTFFGQSPIQQPDNNYGAPDPAYGFPSSTYRPFSISTTPSSLLYQTPHPLTSTYLPVTGNFEATILNNEFSSINDDVLEKDIGPLSELELPKVNSPASFKNSYGVPISNEYALNVPYSVSATAAAAESIKVNTEVLPTDFKKTSIPNESLALANPAPFSLNRGRNIHTLQPVALPNLSVSPLPPIFNARPFRPVDSSKLVTNLIQGINFKLQQVANNVNIAQSVPVAEFTHSFDYPATVIQSPVIDIDATKNRSKSYRNIINGHVVDDYRDITSQASEDHLEATKSNQDISFETTGGDFENVLYDSIPSDFKTKLNDKANHKFADLRGLKEKDIDKYRTEGNLQNIDSPLLYLKPSAPHKTFGDFILAVTTAANIKEYEMYDEIPTTPLPPTLTSWDESRNDYSIGIAPPPSAKEHNEKPKIVQIIVPYTTGKNKEESNYDISQLQKHWEPISEDEYKPRKVAESHTTSEPTTEEAPYSTTYSYSSQTLNTPAILNDLYDVKEPPFDIVKLQHNIDDWTEQEYSNHYRKTNKNRSNGKHSKQIPDEYLTTNIPERNFVTVPTTFDLYDHEGASTNDHTVEEKHKINTKPRKEYNTIERTKNKFTSGKHDEQGEKSKLHIYTAASSFRTSTVVTPTLTPPPWSHIETSISPLTKEKVYVVTSKPWREKENRTNEFDASFESKRKNNDNDGSVSDSFLFKSPRWPNRPSFNSAEDTEPVNSDSLYGFSRNWHQRINSLESRLRETRNATLPEGSEQQNMSKEEGTTTAEVRET